MTNLCPGCISKSEQKRAKLRKELYVDTTGEQDPFLFRLMSLPGTVALSAVLISTLCIGGIVMYAEQYNIVGIALLLAITTGFCTAVTVGAWIIVWTIARRHRPETKVTALFFPPLLYRPLLDACRSDDQSVLWKAVHVAFTAHVVGVVILLATMALSWAVNVDVFDGRSYYQRSG
jgi:hypothetical protein